MLPSRTTKYQRSITGASRPEFQRWNMALTGRFAFTDQCARGDLNQARPTLVMPESASLSAK
jgi:hypothetical protein